MKVLFLILFFTFFIFTSCNQNTRKAPKVILNSLYPPEYISSDTIWANNSVKKIIYKKNTLDLSKVKIFDEYDSTYIENNDLVIEDYIRYVSFETHYISGSNKIDSIEYSHNEYNFSIDANTGDLVEETISLIDSIKLK